MAHVSLETLYGHKPKAWAALQEGGVAGRSFGDLEEAKLEGPHWAAGRVCGPESSGFPFDLPLARPRLRE